VRDRARDRVASKQKAWAPSGRGVPSVDIPRFLKNAEKRAQSEAIQGSKKQARRKVGQPHASPNDKG